MNQQEPFRSSYRGVSAGTRLNGIYEIDEMIGSGGMGEVYKAHEIQTGAAIAIKMLLPEMAENEAALALFRREAAALHNLPHGAIVRYFLFTVEPVLQRPYLAMEFVSGSSLSELLRDKPLSFNVVEKLVRRVASGLQAAHERGIIHRDVSPDNIIIPREGVTNAKIIDFGIARSTQVGDPTIIGSGFAGKENYVSPEQVGLFGGEITPQSDIYSLGLVLFYALTGQKLDMAGTQFQLVEKRRRVPDLEAVDVRARPLLETMLQPDPTMRPRSMAEIANWTFASAVTRDLTKLVDPALSSKFVRAGPRPRHRRLLSGLGVAAACLVVAAAGAWFYRFAGSKTEPRPVPPPVVALRPPTPALQAPPRPNDAASRDQIRDYVEKYDGGDCLVLVPIAISRTAAAIEAYGASEARFDAFAEAFRRQQGFEASVGKRQVTAAQCPALEFVKQSHGEQARAPRIVLNSTEVTNGDTLTGTIENFSGNVVELFLISDRGQAQRLSGLLKPGTDSLSFSIGMQRSENGTAPQLLVAVATPEALAVLKEAQPTAAQTLFANATSEAQHRNIAIAAAARYFTLGK
jgi:serine/threonine-protein kinase